MKKEPSPLSPREQRKQQNRDRIMASAMSLFDAHGFDTVTIEQICEAAAVSRPTFYSYYPTKPDLIAALGQQIWLQVTGEFAASQLAADHSTAGFLRAFFRLVGEEIAEYSRLEKNLILRSMGQDSATRMGVLRGLAGMFEQVYARGRERGDVTERYPVDFLAEMTMGGINAVMMSWATQADYPLAQRLSQLADYTCDMVVFRGIAEK
jgi:AcrR family transcriptional regulator